MFMFMYMFIIDVNNEYSSVISFCIYKFIYTKKYNYIEKKTPVYIKFIIKIKNDSKK